MTYNKKIDILQSQDIIDDVGNIDCMWALLHRCWASINGTGGRRFYEAAQTNTQDYVTFRVRYSKKLSDIRADNTRIAYNGKIYNIKHINDYFEQHRELEIHAEEVL